MAFSSLFFIIFQDSELSSHYDIIDKNYKLNNISSSIKMVSFSSIFRFYYGFGAFSLPLVAIWLA